MMAQNTQLAVPLDPRRNSLYCTVTYQFHNEAPRFLVYSGVVSGEGLDSNTCS